MTDHVRGEKVVFGRQDIPPLEALPSHDDNAAIVLAAPRQFSWTRRFFKVVALLVVLAGITIGGLFVALENGVLDSTLTAQAEAGMSRALGDKFRPEVGSVRLRFSKDWMLAIEARQVVVTHLPSSLAALKADSVKAVLDPLALVAGRVRVTSAELGSADADISFLPAGLAVDWGSMRIDGVPAWLDLLYPLIDGAVVQLDRAGTTRVSAQTMSLVLPGALGHLLVSEKVKRKV